MRNRIQVGVVHLAILSVVLTFVVLAASNSPSVYAADSTTTEGAKSTTKTTNDKTTKTTNDKITKTNAKTSKTMVISPAILEKYSTVTVTVNEDGKDKEFKGVPLRLLLSEMMPGSLASMPNWKNLARQELVLEVKGDDGYPGLVTAAEVAINESGDRYILATKENGKPIDSGVRMICKLDEHHVRWVHSIVSLRLAGVKK